MDDSPVLWTKEQCVEAYDEMMLRIALSRYAELDGQDSLDENDRLKATPEYAVTPETEKRIRRTVQREYFRKSVRRTAGRVYRAASLVAVIFMGVSILFGTTVFASSQLRVKLVSWLVETFPEYSNFGVTTDMPFTEESHAMLSRYKPTYIPDGFTEFETHNEFPSIDYVYENEDGFLLGITGRIPGGGAVGMNTEDAVIETIVYRGEVAYYWERNDGFSYFTFILDGFHFYIAGPIDRSEIFKIAENIKIDKNEIIEIRSCL